MSINKVAIIGGGTAGFMSAAMVSIEHPKIDLYHIYDTKRPAIGVGEGSFPYLIDLLKGITGKKESWVLNHLNSTKKHGIKFEGWGDKNSSFIHWFHPKGKYGLHFSAKEIVHLLKKYIKANTIDENVINIDKNDSGVILEFESGGILNVDFLIDATGFPKNDEERQIIDIVPTNSAIITTGGVVDYNLTTRSIAMPHGWIFIIPLTNRTSYGYIYNNNISHSNDVIDSVKLFLDKEGVAYGQSFKYVSFPNFVSKNIFD